MSIPMWYSGVSGAKRIEIVKDFRRGVVNLTLNLMFEALADPTRRKKE
ncbi:hypothetical protein J2128_001850 [Methanomicrobium sp. W14]|nr:hypothetical protein [Methanomicrobium sp. W14]MBP2133896.1 hypothetical protein [Methanomicrobium sp. W14]